jgi:hypothetical protein
MRSRPRRSSLPRQHRGSSSPDRSNAASRDRQRCAPGAPYPTNRVARIVATESLVNPCLRHLMATRARRALVKRHHIPGRRNSFTDRGISVRKGVLQVVEMELRMPGGLVLLDTRHSRKSMYDTRRFHQGDHRGRARREHDRGSPVQWSGQRGLCCAASSRCGPRRRPLVS